MSRATVLTTERKVVHTGTKWTVTEDSCGVYIWDEEKNLVANLDDPEVVAVAEMLFALRPPRQDKAVAVKFADGTEVKI